MTRPVLVIDDNADVRVLLARILRLIGERAVCVSGGREALEYLRHGGERPKLVLLDWMMPEMDGLAVLQAIRSDPELSGLPVVVFSGAGERELRQALVSGANDYLRKGLDILLDALALLVRGGAADRGRFHLAVVGRDPDAARFEARARDLGIQDRVRFLGPRRDIPEILAGADVLCLPTRFDAYANVSSEALASGTPVIASATSGASELIRPAFGRVLARNEAPDLAAALSEVLSVEDLEPLRRAAREAALPLAWAKHYAEIESIYAEAAARVPGGSKAAPRAPGHAR